MWDILANSLLVESPYQTLGADQHRLRKGPDMARKKNNRLSWTLGLGIVLSLGLGEARANAVIVSPDEGTTQVIRVYDDSSAGLVTYVVVRDDDTSVKYQDAPVGLGEDGAVETDVFVITADSGGDSVTVETKASPETATVTVTGVGDSQLNDLGFRVDLIGIAGDTYTLAITSEGVDHALSHVTFTIAEAEPVAPLFEPYPLYD